LSVPDPSLRLDLLQRIQNEPYNGQHRNIFSEEPLPPPPDVIAQQKAAAAQPVTPLPPPPLMIPVTFYGIVTNPATGRRQACFSGNDNIYIVPEGGTLLNQFRIVKVGNNTVDVQEISSGRSTTLTLPEPGSQPNPGQPFAQPGMAPGAGQP
jgi:hypothetical protein